MMSNSQRFHVPATAAIVLLSAWIHVRADVAPGPAQSSSVALTPDEKTLCAVNQDSGSISLWNWATDKRVKEIAVGDEPRTLAVSPDGQFVYVATERSQTLAIVNVGLGQCVDRIPIGGQPVSVVLAADGQSAFVSQYAGDYVDGKYHPGVVAVVDLKARRVRARIPVKARPFGLALGTGGKFLWVTHYFQIDGRGYVTEIDTQRMAVRREIPLDEDADVAGGRGGVFNAIAGIAIHPEGKRALLVGMHANVRRGMTQSGMPLSHKTTVQAAIRVLDLETGQEIEPAMMISSFFGQAVAVPVAVAFLGGGDHFLDVYFDSNDMKVFRYNEQGLVAERALFELPLGPSGVALMRDGRTGFFNCRWTRSVAEVSLANIRQPQLVRQIQVAQEPWDAMRVLGARVFHNTRDTRMTPNRWMSCGVCHLDGGLVSDNLIWEFNDQQKPGSPHLLNTPSLSLASGSSPPFLVTGKFQTVQEEDNLIRLFLGGSGFIPLQNGSLPADPVGKSREMDAVAAFVLSLRPRPNPHMQGNQPRPEIRESAKRGYRLFHSDRVGCNSCHDGPYLTQSGRGRHTQLADVGTGRLADVPSLLNLWETAPYLHDGRAKTLHDVLTTCNPDDKHGKTAHLTAQEITDLISFLLAPYQEKQR